MKKYLCFGGNVISRHDGDRHYISARQLARLYQVPHNECVYIERGQDIPLGYIGKDMIKLHPRPNGDYCLPGVNEPKGSRTR
jgi:hypothetical protein